MALQYVSYFRFTSILVNFINIWIIFDMTRILTGWHPGCLVPVTPSSIQTFPRPSSYIPCFPLSRPNWWPFKRKYAYMQPIIGIVSISFLLTTNLLLSFVSKWLSPGLQKSVDLLLSLSSTLSSHLGVNPNLLYKGSTSASMYLKSEWHLKFTLLEKWHL